MENPNAWTTLLQFHQRAYSKSPNGEAGLAAVRKVHELFGPDWNCTYEPQHYLKHRLWTANEPSYGWLVHFAQKLEFLSTIPGSGDIISRLDNRASYWAAWSELDFTLKLALGGFDCRFIPTSRASPTPDLLATRDQLTLIAEITSMNPMPREGLSFGIFMAVEMAALRQRATVRGFFSRVPSELELDQIEDKVREASKEANEKKRPIKVNMHGLMTVFVAPRDLVSEIPARWRDGFSMKGFHRVPLADRLARTIREKVKAQLGESKTALVAIYDQLSFEKLFGPREEEKFFEDPAIELLLGTYPNLLGAVLIQPLVSVLELETKRTVAEEGILLEHSLPDFEAERCVVWRNLLSDDSSSLNLLVDCLENFPARLRLLYK